MKSTNGAFVNGKRVEQKYITEDDEIVIGKHTVMVDINNYQKKSKTWNSSQIDRTYKMSGSPLKKIYVSWNRPIGREPVFTPNKTGAPVAQGTQPHPIHRINSTGNCHKISAPPFAVQKCGDFIAEKIG